MNRFATIIGIGLAVASLTFAIVADLGEYTRTQCYVISGVSLIISSVLVHILFWVEGRIKKNGGQLVNRIAYLLGKKSKPYVIEEVDYTYSCLPGNKYKYEKKMRIRINSSEPVEFLEEGFRWSAPANMADIKAIDSRDRIGNIHEKEAKTCFLIFFNRRMNNNEVVAKTGFVVDNLNDPENHAFPFLSVTVRKRTRVLHMNINIPKDCLPETVTFYAKFNGEIVTKRETLSYNFQKNCYCKKIEYPRKGWQYIISWEK